MHNQSAGNKFSLLKARDWINHHFGGTKQKCFLTYSYFEKGCWQKCTQQFYFERYCEWFGVHCSSKKFERMAWEAIDVCLQLLKKESSNRRFDSYSARNSILIISHITFQDCRVHIFSDKLSLGAVIKDALCRVTNIYFLLKISMHNQEKSYWEFIKWSPLKKDALIFKQILLTSSSRK